MGMGKRGGEGWNGEVAHGDGAHHFAPVPREAEEVHFDVDAGGGGGAAVHHEAGVFDAEAFCKAEENSVGAGGGAGGGKARFYMILDEGGDFNGAETEKEEEDSRCEQAGK